MYLTKEEKKDKLSKYTENISDELFVFLRRNMKVTEYKFDFMSKPTKFIQVGDKQRPLDNNKKYLVNYIFNHVEDDWKSLGNHVIRRTIKKYLDSVA